MKVLRHTYITFLMKIEKIRVYYADYIAVEHRLLKQTSRYHRDQTVCSSLVMLSSQIIRP